MCYLIRRRCAILLLLWLGGISMDLQSAVTQIENRNAEHFTTWRKALPDRDKAVDGFEAFLQQQQLSGLVPLHQLLRSASMWQDCKAEPYAIPPDLSWPDVSRTLQLLRELKQQGILTQVEVHSAYREPKLNRCAGGASKSAHRVSFALDLAPLADQNATARLCQFWRQHGEKWQMGLSRYPSGRIHIDTMRYRTWGADHSKRSSLCLSSAGPGLSVK